MAAPATAALDPTISTIVAYLRHRVPSLASSDSSPLIAIVCGSGLSGLSERITSPTAVPYSDIPGFPRATVAGHGTELVFGYLGANRVVAQRGRFHFYEGYGMSTVALPVRVFAALGARVMVATNAAGGVNAAFRVGDVMVIRDHVSLPGLSGANPLVGANAAAFGPRFPPLTAAYAPSLQALAASVAKDRGLGAFLRSGVYLHDSGPTYETPSEIAAMRVLGGDAVGMSTAPEVVAAAHAGMAVLGLSLITNQCRCVLGARDSPQNAAVRIPTPLRTFTCPHTQHTRARSAPGDTGVPPSHEEVLEATERRAADMQGLVADIVARIQVAEFAEPAAFAAYRSAPTWSPLRAALSRSLPTAAAIASLGSNAALLLAVGLGLAALRSQGGAGRDRSLQLAMQAAVGSLLLARVAGAAGGGGGAAF